MVNSFINKSLIAQGDQRKFKQLMELTADELLLFAMGFLKRKDIAEEIVSDVYVKIWENRAELETIKNLKSYLFICIKNGCLTHLRKEKKGKIISIDEFEDFHFLPVESPENNYIDSETTKQLYQAIEKLPPKCKLAFTLAKINGLKYKEIAEVMGVSEKTVNNHLVMAVKKLTEILYNQKTIQTPSSPLKRASLFSFFW